MLLFFYEERVEFYPYGIETEGDSTLGSSDEATSGREILDKPICFFGKNYSSLVVSTRIIFTQLFIHYVFMHANYIL